MVGTVMLVMYNVHIILRRDYGFSDCVTSTPSYLYL